MESNLWSKTSIRTTDTRYFSDPSIATESLGVGPKDLLDDLNSMGFLFENLYIRDLRIYTDYLDRTVYDYRDRNGLECDAVIHLRNGAYGLVEIKLGGDKLIEESAETLKALASKIDIKICQNHHLCWYYAPRHLLLIKEMMKFT